MHFYFNMLIILFIYKEAFSETVNSTENLNWRQFYYLLKNNVIFFIFSTDQCEGLIKKNQLAQSKFQKILIIF